jgi:surface antigen
MAALAVPIRAAVLFAAVLFAALATGLPAPAQFLGPGFRTSIELTKQDLEIMRRTVNSQVRGQAVGAAAKWTNPASGNSGTVRLVRKFMRNGQQCESLEYTLSTTRRPVRPEHHTLSSCLQPDGQWRLI